MKTVQSCTICATSENQSHFQKSFWTLSSRPCTMRHMSPKKKKVFGSHLSLICLYDFVFKVNTIYHVLQLCGLWILSITVHKTDHVTNIKKQSRIPLSHSTLDPQSNHSWQSRPFLIRVKQIWHLHSVDVRVPLAPPHCCSANGIKFTFSLCFLPVYACSKLYT